MDDQVARSTSNGTSSRDAAFAALLAGPPSVAAAREAERRLEEGVDRRTARLAIEDWLGRADALDWTAPHAAATVLRLIERSAQPPSKQVAPLVARLRRAGHEAAAADLSVGLLTLFPTTPVYFKGVAAIPDSARRAAVADAHFSRLRAIGDVDALMLIAQQCIQLGRFEAAAELFDQPPLREAVAARPDLAWWRAEALFWSDRFDAALAVLDDTLNAHPAPPAPERLRLLRSRARSLLALGQTEAAAAALDALPQSETISPLAIDVFAGVASGDMRRAFAPYWAAAALEPLGALPAPTLTEAAFDTSGRRGEARCTVVCVMGVGDQVRFAPLFDEIGSLFAQTTVLCDQRLEPIFRRSVAKVDVLGVDPDRTPPGLPAALHGRIDDAGLACIADGDVVAELKQFCLPLRSSVEAFPKTGHHLTPDPTRVARWRHWLAGARATPVGLFWRSDLAAHSARHKQSALEDWLDLLGDLPVSIVPLQYGMSDAERARIADDPRFMSPSEVDLHDDLEEVFALLAALPLTLTLPGTLQHMAGAVGARTICAAHPFEAAWRRRPGSEQDLWGPSVRIVTGRPEDGLMGAMRIAAAEARAVVEAEAAS